MGWRQNKVRYALNAHGMIGGGFKIIAARALGVDNVRLVALRREAITKPAQCHSRFEECPTREIREVLHGKNVRLIARIQGRFERIKAVEAVVGRAVVVHEKTRSENVGRREVYLPFGEVAKSPDTIAVGARGQLRHDVEVVFAFQGVQKPGLAFTNRPRDHSARSPSVDVDSLAALERRHEIGAGEAKAIVSHAGSEAEDPARALAVLHRVTAALDVHGCWLNT